MNCCGRHLAGGHRELLVLDLARAADVAGDRHVVGRVADNELRALVPQEGPIALRAEGIAAEQAVVAELPEVARPRDDFGADVLLLKVVRIAPASGSPRRT